MEKILFEQVYRYFLSQGYTIIGEYKNTNKYVLCERKDGIRCFVSYSSLKSGKRPIIWGKYNYDNLSYNIKTFLKNNNSNTKFISWELIKKRQRTRCFVVLQCECGQTFKKALEDVIYKKAFYCNQCSLRNRGNKRRSKNAKKIVEQAGYYVLVGDKNYRLNDKFEVEDKEGYRGFISATTVKRGCKMSRFDRRINNKYYIYNVNVWIKHNCLHLECLGFDEQLNKSNQGLKFRCSCGNKFSTTIAAFQNGKFRCEKCTKSISNLEYKFKNYLDFLNIKYIYQYSLNQCRDILPLPFDFYLCDYNVLIEIDGEGHYKICHFNQIGYKEAKRTFEITKKHDEIKNKYCADNNIKLIRIPYFLFNTKNEYKDFFQKSLNE